VLNSNTKKSWTWKDHLDRECALGNPEYLRWKAFVNKYPEFQHGSVQSLLLLKRSGQAVKNIAGKHLRSKEFEDGTMTIPNFKKSEEYAQKLRQLKKYYPGYNRTIFVRTMIGMFENPNYNHEIFLNKLEAQPGRLIDCLNIDRYKDLIEQIYNYRNQNKVNLRIF
jgi:hypothetical protein